MNGLKFLGMEHFGARDETTKEVSLIEVERADLYVGVIGGRYGSGITELEYECARAKGTPCFIYIKRDPAITVRDDDAIATAKLGALGKRLRRAHTCANSTRRRNWRLSSRPTCTTGCSSSTCRTAWGGFRSISSRGSRASWLSTSAAPTDQCPSAPGRRVALLNDWLADFPRRRTFWSPVAQGAASRRCWSAGHRRW